MRDYTFGLANIIVINNKQTSQNIFFLSLFSCYHSVISPFFTPFLSAFPCLSPLITIYIYKKVIKGHTYIPHIAKMKKKKRKEKKKKKKFEKKEKKV